MDYEKGYVFDLMEQGGPTDVREPYFREAVDEMMRARVLCAGQMQRCRMILLMWKIWKNSSGENLMM